MRLRYYCILLLFTGFLIGCSSGSENSGSESDGSIEEKEYVLSRGSIMDHDSLKNNYKFIGEWKLDNNETTIKLELYNSKDKNVIYNVLKDMNTMNIYETKRNGNRYYLNIPFEGNWYEMDESGNFTRWYNGLSLNNIDEDGSISFGDDVSFYMTKIR